MQFTKRVWDYCASRDLLHAGDCVVLGVSGGPDSLCLLDVFANLAVQHRLTLIVAHFNHDLRPEAAADEEFVQAEAAQRGLEYAFEAGDVRAAAAANRQSLEAAARGLRYAFLQRVAQETGASCVAVAHSADDQAETVLLRLLRGAGLRGLRGMLPKRPLGEGVSLVRPLLGMTRAEILDYCAAHGLTPRWDSSNADTRFARNRVRHDLLPILETYNPNLRAVLARTAAVAAGDYDIWSQAVARLWAETVLAESGNTRQVAFGRSRWLALGHAQQRALLRLAVEQLLGAQDEIDFSPLEAAVSFGRMAQPGRKCDVAAGLHLRVETDRLVVGRIHEKPETSSLPRMVSGALAPGWRLIVAMEASDAQPLPAASRWTVRVDADRLAGPLALRTRRPGDRFQPWGMGGHSVKLSDFFVNLKVPAWQRDDWPLLVCGEEIVWVTGLRLDERYRLTEKSHRVTRLSVQLDPSEPR